MDRSKTTFVSPTAVSPKFACPKFACPTAAPTFPPDDRPLIRVYHDGCFVGYRDANSCNRALESGKAIRLDFGAIETAVGHWSDK